MKQKKIVLLFWGALGSICGVLMGAVIGGAKGAIIGALLGAVLGAAIVGGLMLLFGMQPPNYPPYPD